MAMSLGFSRRRTAWAMCAGLLWLTSCQHTGAVAGAAGATQGSQDATAQAPLSALRADIFRYRFGIYTPRAPTVDVKKALADAASPYGFKLVSQSVGPELPPKSTSVFLTFPPIEKFAPPSADTMRFMAADLNEAEQRQLGACQSVAVFEVVGPGARAFEDYRSALKLSAELAQKLGGFLWDEETRTAHTLQSWQNRLDSWQGGVPFINRHVAIHQYRDGELFRIVSLGMVKLGLPDIAVNQVSGTDADQMGRLVDLLLQKFVEGAAPNAQQQLMVALDDVHHAEMRQWLAPNVSENAERRVVLSLVPIEPDEGDSDNRLLELAFPGDKARTQERHAAALSALFGSQDSVLTLEHDAELLAASARARKKAFALRERFSKGPQYGEELLVKARFETPDGNGEWMWVEVVSWQGGTIDGLVTEDAFDIPTLKRGARVEVKAEEIFDYLFSKPDGTSEGNETGPLIEARAKGRRDKK
mgnify:CR=1 FL=1